VSIGDDVITDKEGMDGLLLYLFCFFTSIINEKRGYKLYYQTKWLVNNSAGDMQW
jgi:hypothetical protein